MSGAGATDRLARLLALVPYLVKNRGVEVARAALDFGITEDQLVKDLELVFVCGLPGHLPDDLIEADWESGRIYLDNADAIAQPLRLVMDEVIALLVGLRALADVPGGDDSGALASATAKLTAAAGEAATLADALSVDLDDDSDPAVRALAEQAVSQGRRLHLRYLVPGRDEATERDLDPHRVVNLAGAWYVQGWCHRAQARRTFRLSRVLHAHLLDVPVAQAPPPEGDLEDVLAPGADAPVVELELDARHRWVAEQYPPVQERMVRSRLVVTIPVWDPGWVRQLALLSGGGVRVRSPRWLAEQVAEEARRALAVTQGEQD